MIKEKSPEKERGNFNISIRSWLVIPPVFLLITSIVLVGFILIRFNINNSLIVFDELQENMEEQVTSQLEEKLYMAEQLNKINLSMLEAKILDPQSVESREVYFYNILSSYPDAAMSFIGLRDGTFYGARRNSDGSIYIARNNESTDGGSFYYSADEAGRAVNLEEMFPNFDARTRPWYQIAAQRGQPSFSEVYVHFTFQEPTITASQPVYDQEGQLSGVFGVNYLLSWLDDLLESLLIGDDGQIILIDGKKNIIATTLPIDTYEMMDDKIDLVKLNAVDNIFIEKANQLLLEGKLEDRQESSRQLVTIEDNKYFTGSIDLNYRNLDWKLIFLLSEKDFLGDINKCVRNAVVLLAFLILLSIAASSLIAKKIAQPIEKLSLASENLWRGKDLTVVNSENIVEIHTLTESFIRMSQRMADMMSNLEQEIKLRTKELELTNTKLRRLSYEDGLTGICNRREFDQAYDHAWQLALIQKKEIALFMMDIDYFKGYNDSFGHLKGDEALKLIADELSKNLRRSTDLLARYGGEEFVVLIEEVEKEQLLPFAERLRQSIEDLNIEYPGSEYSKVTISIGVSYIRPEEGMEKEILINYADEALYKAKNSGRNKVSF